MGVRAHARALAVLLLAVWPSVSATKVVDLQARVERAAAREAHRSVAAPDRLEILSVRFGGADPVDPGGVELRLAEIDGPNAAGYLRMRFTLLADGTPRGEARATVRGIVRGPAVVSVGALRHGREIRPDEVIVEDSELTRLVAAPLRDVGDVVGKVPVRSLGAGRVLTRELIRRAPVVRRGETVELLVRRPGLAVRTKGVVRRDAAPGDTVPVRSLSSGVELLAYVEDDGTLVVGGTP